MDMGLLRLDWIGLDFTCGQGRVMSSIFGCRGRKVCTGWLGWYEGDVVLGARGVRGGGCIVLYLVQRQRVHISSQIP